MSCQSNGESEKVSSPRDRSILVNSGAEHGTHSLNQQMATAGFAGTLAPSTSSVERLCPVDVDSPSSQSLLLALDGLEYLGCFVGKLRAGGWNACCFFL
ncbi:hypothetical protein MTR67_036256 [Solanum verrucosum]|uniref:Uncharacterized protein n=1 Tax=Solanum verrucosum TaxID=315347 RepID=A0AAF0ZKS1_SOLVR|nr:hypothetical protein MTR67_036256 [Solanum verrucosum]